MNKLASVMTNKSRIINGATILYCVLWGAPLFLEPSGRVAQNIQRAVSEEVYYFGSIVVLVVLPVAWVVMISSRLHRIEKLLWFGALLYVSLSVGVFATFLVLVLLCSYAG